MLNLECNSLIYLTQNKKNIFEKRIKKKREGEKKK